MPMLRAMRTINAIEAGTLTAAGLNSLLADPGRLAEFNALTYQRGQMRRMVAGATTMSAVLASANARAAVFGSLPALSAMLESHTARGLLFGSSTYRNALAGSSGAMSIIAAHPDMLAALITDANMLSALVASQTAVFAIGARAAATSVIDSTPAARALYYGASVAGGYLGVIHAINDDRYAVIQAPKASGENASVQWKTSNDASSNTSDDDFGLINANAQNNATHPLFQWARSQAIGGFSDWAPPAYNVIQSIAAKHRQGVAENTLFKAGGAQAYETTNYWSATQHSSYTGNAWYVNFSSGAVGYSSKTTTYRARLVRMVKL